jgi:hypothetical protein
MASEHSADSKPHYEVAEQRKTALEALRAEAPGVAVMAEMEHMEK